MENWRKKPRVLIIDDDDDFVSDMTIMLSSEFEITSAGSTLEARDRWAKYPPKCVLLDLHLPRHFGDDPQTEGLSFIDHISNDPAMRSAVGVPVIAVTSGAGTAPAGKVQELGIAAVYRKPPDLKRLKTAIWHLIASREETFSGPANVWPPIDDSEVTD
jgi:CheY-like chemotaxis protein